MASGQDGKGGAKAKTKPFEEVAALAGIKTETLAKLLDNDFDTVVAVRLLTDVDCKSLGLSLGQLRVLQKWRDTLGPKKTPDLSLPKPMRDDSSAVTTAKLNKDKEMAELLKSLKQRPGDDLWLSDNEDDDNDGRQPDPRPQGKAYLIPDFVTKASHGTGDEGYEREVCNQGGAQLILRQSRIKPLPEQVTLAQFISANARIMARLVKEGRLKGEADLLDYLEYTADVGDYAQVCDIGTVMLYDNEYRKKQSRKDRKWGEDDIHLSTFYLQRRRKLDAPAASTSSQSRTNKAPKQFDRRGVEICKSYNGWGCHRDTCRFSHVCSICKEGHPKSFHSHPGGNGPYQASSDPHQGNNGGQFSH